MLLLNVMAIKGASEDAAAAAPRWLAGDKEAQHQDAAESIFDGPAAGHLRSCAGMGRRC